MPAASVSVQSATESSFFSNSSSTTRRYFGRRPAWWTPTPRRSICFSLGPTPLGHSSLSHSLFTAAFCAAFISSSPFNCSPMLQHSSRLNANTRAGVLRVASSPLAMSTSKSLRNWSGTQR
ncbi:hypothetical protein [Frigoriglobus tundricola]|uniref:hypothetical protein n=1 Tax=Frigoriglobus tundricola TaxID=2774151 RepID=UPI001D08E2D1|nr:hypothetical protein [Frigoriglobus tundricola]